MSDRTGEVEEREMLMGVIVVEERVLPSFALFFPAATCWARVIA